MASGIPQKIDDLIYQRLNEYNKNSSVIPELQLQDLVKKAKTLNQIEQYTCLAALYSHAFKHKKTKENAIKAIAYCNGEKSYIINASAALININLCRELVEISKTNSILLEYTESRQDVYDAALYALDLEYCDMITEKYGLPDIPRANHKDLLDFFDHDNDLLEKGGKYIDFALENLIKVLKVNSVRTSSLQLDLVNSDDDSFLGLTVNFKNLSIDKVIDMEDQWYSHLAKFSVSDDKLCNMSFTMRDDS